jgi:hypothetical protein
LLIAIDCCNVCVDCYCSYRCKWTAEDECAGWVRLDAREQLLRSPVRTAAHCLELGIASGMFTADVMQAWEGELYKYTST